VASGLGPRFNLDSCAGCHTFPAVGGSSPPTNNPQFMRAATMAPGSTVPSFLSINGPIREVRFIRKPNGTPDGGVHDIFTIVGRSDSPTGCAISQPDFSNANNMIFRIPTPVFGAGLIQAITDTTIKNNLASDPTGLKRRLGISGHVNTSGNDGTVTRFGWKAQNKSLLIFAGEAYNVEMGISNELFPQDRPLPGEDGNGGTGSTGLVSNCLNLTGTGYPEDTSNPTQTSNPAVLDDVSAFANFMRFLAPPPTGTVFLKGNQVAQSSINNGASLFSAIGCGTCHNASPGNTQVSNFVSVLSNQPVPAFSDIEIHHMGTKLADNVAQGGAGGDQFRTAPLWGLGQRIFLLHDGRCQDLLCAIEAHESNGGEATQVESIFDNNLSTSQQQDVLNFLRSL